MVCIVVVSLAVRDGQCDGILPSSDWKMHCEKSSIYSEEDADIKVDFRGSVVDFKWS